MSVRTRGVVIGIVVAALAVVVPTASMSAAGGCSADSVLLGQVSRLTGPTPTDWFNVFGEGLDPGGAWAVTFSIPVMPWPLPGPLTYDPTKEVSALVMPTDPTGGFKWTVRPKDVGVKSLTVTVSDGTCTASHLVVLMPSTSTDPEPRDAPFPLLPALAGATLGAALALRPTRRERRTPGDIPQR